MSVTSVTERYQEQVGTDEQDSVTSTRVFHAITSAATDDDQIVLADSRIPVQFGQHPNNENLVVRRRQAKRGLSDDWAHWIVTISYAL